MKWVADRRYHHAHECDHCGLVWEHDPPTQFEFDSEEEMEEARTAYNLGHTCPTCHVEQIRCYEGTKPANASHGGGKPTTYYQKGKTA